MSVHKDGEDQDKHTEWQSSCLCRFDQETSAGDGHVGSDSAAAVDLLSRANGQEKKWKKTKNRRKWLQGKHLQ